MTRFYRYHSDIRDILAMASEGTSCVLHALANYETPAYQRVLGKEYFCARPSIDCFDTNYDVR